MICNSHNSGRVVITLRSWLWDPGKFVKEMTSWWYRPGEIIAACGTVGKSLKNHTVGWPKPCELNLVDGIVWNPSMVVLGFSLMECHSDFKPRYVKETVQVLSYVDPTNLSGYGAGHCCYATCSDTKGVISFWSGRSHVGNLTAA